jgi:hypothetical protein
MHQGALAVDGGVRTLAVYLVLLYHAGLPAVAGCGGRLHDVGNLSRSR